MPSAWYQPTPAHQEIHKPAPVPVVLPEAVPAPEQDHYSGPKVCLPGKTEPAKPPESAAEKPVVIPAVKERKPQKDSLSRYVSLQTSIAIVMLMVLFGLRAIS